MGRRSINRSISDLDFLKNARNKIMVCYDWEMAKKYRNIKWHENMILQTFEELTSIANNPCSTEPTYIRTSSCDLGTYRIRSK